MLYKVIYCYTSLIIKADMPITDFWHKTSISHKYQQYISTKHAQKQLITLVTLAKLHFFCRTTVSSKIILKKFINNTILYDII